MTDRKRTTAIQVRVTEQEKRRMERQAKQCGLSLSGYLRRVGVGKTAAAFPSQRFRDLYQQVNRLRENFATQPTERTAAQLDGLAGQLLTAYDGAEIAQIKAERDRLTAAMALYRKDIKTAGEVLTRNDRLKENLKLKREMPVQRMGTTRDKRRERSVAR